MRVLAYPFLALLPGIPLAAAAGLRWTPRPRSARALAVAAAATTAVVAVALAIFAAGAPEAVLADPVAWSTLGESRPLFLLDGVSRVAAPLVALLGLAVVLATPPTEATVPTAQDQLLFLGASELLYVSADLGLFAVAWLATLLPLLRSVGRGGGRGGWRVVAASLLGGWLLLVLGLGLVVLEARRAGLAAPCFLPDLAAAGPRAAGALALLLLAALVRKGLFPCQSWVLVLVERASPGLVALGVASHAGATLLARVVLPLFPGAAASSLVALDQLGLATAILAALAAVTPRSPRRVFGWLAISQSALLMLGLVSRDHLAVVGSLVQWVALGASLTGMLLGIWLAEARVGRADMRRYGGVAAGAPALAGFFVLFAFASVGFPTTLGFVGEDLLFHGVLGTHPWRGVGMILVTALNGVTAYRLFARIFLGPAPRTPVPDLRPAERTALAGLALALVLAGLYPARLVADRAAPARGLDAAAFSAPAVPR